MILAQMFKVLPAGETFKIMDMNKPVLNGFVSTTEKIPVFGDAHEDLKYMQVYSAFHVELIDKVDDVWVINVR